MYVCMLLFNVQTKEKKLRRLENKIKSKTRQSERLVDMAHRRTDQTERNVQVTATEYNMEYTLDRTGVYRTHSVYSTLREGTSYGNEG